MTDRELLTLAAKAAGLTYTWDEGRIRVEGSGFTGHNPNYHYWNPLTDDGDALRLAVGLRMVVSVEDEFVGVIDPAGRETTVDYSDFEPLAATRRAIVVAAAQLGKALA